MAKRIRLGYVDDVPFLRNFLHMDYDIVYPVVNIINGVVEYNFDYLLVVNGTPKLLVTMANEYDIPMIGYNRIDKYKQLQLLNLLEIPHAKFYKTYTEDSEVSKLYPLLDEYEEDDLLMIKHERGARGIGQVLLSKTDIYAFIDCMDRDKDIFNEKYNWKIGGLQETQEQKDEVLDFLSNSLDNGCFHIEEYIQIKEEYRVLYFYNQEPLITKRELSTNGWQSNSCISGGGVIVDYNSLSKDLKNNILNYSTMIAANVNAPVLALDFYIDEHDTVGVLEFQMEYAYRVVNKTEMYKRTKQAFKEFIKQMEK